jgi:cyclopropane fatty-acyl-phospholipid synthase-like methyltransferase
VESDADRVARGVDLDAEVLTAAHTLNREPLDEDEAERFELEHADARDLSDRTFDIITAGNYSWALFDEAALSRYLASARHCLEDEGMLALELFGGADLTRPLVQEHAGAGFTYVWEQTHYDPASRRLDAAIHFRLDSGRVLRDAFRYRFTLRGWPETKAAMRASGFTGVRLWVESPSGGFSKRHTSPDAAVWGGYAVGFNGPSR